MYKVTENLPQNGSVFNDGKHTEQALAQNGMWPGERPGVPGATRLPNMPVSQPMSIDVRDANMGTDMLPWQGANAANVIEGNNIEVFGGNTNWAQVASNGGTAPMGEVFDSPKHEKISL